MRRVEELEPLPAELLFINSINSSLRSELIENWLKKVKAGVEWTNNQAAQETGAVKIDGEWSALWVGFASSFGGLWALQRQWLRPKERTQTNQPTKEREWSEIKQSERQIKDNWMINEIGVIAAAWAVFDERNGAPSSTGCAVSSSTTPSINHSMAVDCGIVDGGMGCFCF